MLIDDNLRYKINKLLEEIKSTIGETGHIKLIGSADNALKKRSGRYQNTNLKWSREEVKYGPSKGMKYYTSFNVNSKKYNITVIGKITDIGVEHAEVIFALDKHKGKSNVTDLTGTGDSFKVMSTVLNSLIELANDRKEIQSVWWTSDDNKTPLFKRLSKMVPAGLDFICSYSSSISGGVEKMKFTRTSEKKDNYDIDINVIINPNDIKSTYLKVAAMVEDIFLTDSDQYRCGFHPYIYSETYTKDRIKLLALDEKVQERIYQMLEFKEESHIAIKAILCRELRLKWSKSDLSKGYIKFKGEEIRLEDAVKVNNPQCLILKHRRNRIECKVSSDLSLDISIIENDVIKLKSMDLVNRKYNARLEEGLLYGEYYKMFKTIRRFLNGIFIIGMYRKKDFNREQYFYLKRSYEDTFNNKNTLITNNSNAMNTVVKVYDDMIKLKIFKSYGRKN